MKKSENCGVSVDHEVELDISQLIDLAENAGRSFIGIIDNCDYLRSIKIARKFMVPNAYYGHRYAKNVSAIVDVRKAGEGDLHLTDSRGYLLNQIDGEDSDSRLRAAKADGAKIIALFGGSTLMGQGSRLPQFTIPSLLEKLLQQEYGISSVCLNCGLGGTYSQDALNLLSSEMLNEQPDMVLFYDGWNCCSYLSTIQMLKISQTSRANYNFFNGMGIRHFEHDLVLYNQYDFLSLMKRLLVLCVHYFLIAIEILVPTAFIKKFVRAVAERFFPLRSHASLSSILNEIEISEESIEAVTKRSVSEYWNIHNRANYLCQQNSITFYTFFQPLTFFGQKQLTKEEQDWKDNGFSSGDPKIFHSFYKYLSKDQYPDYFVDATNFLDDEKEQIYIDSGHINSRGNFLVAQKIAQAIHKDLQ